MTNDSSQIPIAKPRRYLLKKSEMVRGYRTFSSIISEGCLLKEKQFQCYFLHRPAGERTVFVGFAVGKSKGSAVLRNRARRKLREAYRLCKHHLLTESPLWSGELRVIFMLTKSLDRHPESFLEMQHGMSRILTKLNMRLATTGTVQ
ncbi:MAG: ribonuclease P protein component [bacterium]